MKEITCILVLLLFSKMMISQSLNKVDYKIYESALKYDFENHIDSSRNGIITLLIVSTTTRGHKTMGFNKEFKEKISNKEDRFKLLFGHDSVSFP